MSQIPFENCKALDIFTGKSTPIFLGSLLTLMVLKLLDANCVPPSPCPYVALAPLNKVAQNILRRPRKSPKSKMRKGRSAAESLWGAATESTLI